jgi:hypothetical protein
VDVLRRCLSEARVEVDVQWPFQVQLLGEQPTAGYRLGNIDLWVAMGLDVISHDGDRVAGMT